MAEHGARLLINNPDSYSPERLVAFASSMITALELRGGTGRQEATVDEDPRRDPIPRVPQTDWTRRATQAPPIQSAGDLGIPRPTVGSESLETPEARMDRAKQMSLRRSAPRVRRPRARRMALRLRCRIDRVGRGPGLRG